MASETSDPQQNDHDDIDEYFNHPLAQAAIPATRSIHPWLAPVNSQAGILMSHCKLFCRE